MQVMRAAPARPEAAHAALAMHQLRAITLAATVSASSSDIGSVSATVASAESDQITFADFTTGAITATEKRLSVNAASTSQSPPSAPVSIHA
jgi:hypothetical protein